MGHRSTSDVPGWISRMTFASSQNSGPTFANSHGRRGRGSYVPLGVCLIMFRKVDCVRLHVGDLDSALAFYSRKLGHPLLWKDGTTAAGLQMGGSGSELVLVSGESPPETDLKVDSVERSIRQFVEAGGRVVEPPFDIKIGRCAVVQDPWGNRLVLLDSSKGLLKTDAEGNVVG